MKKEQMTVRGMIDQHQVNCDRMREIADLCEREERSLNEKETAEYNQLRRENEILQMRMQAASAQQYQTVPTVNTDQMLRENLLDKGTKVTVTLMREVTPQTTAALADTGIIPVAQQEMLNPIRKGLIWDKVGLNIRSGLAGTLRWPKHGKAVASFADEAERLVDSKIDFGKLEMTGSRIGIALPVTKEELEDSEGIVESVIREEAPAAVIDVINDALFCTDKNYTGADGQSHVRKVFGPFASETVNTVDFTASVPTRKELLKMVTAVASKVDLKSPCWVMTEAMKAELRDVKVDAGSGRFLCENDMILGYPVFTTPIIGEAIGFGDWSYQAAGFFGEMSFIADPYTLARNHAVDFVLNGRFGTATLRDDAFVLGKKKA